MLGTQKKYPVYFCQPNMTSPTAYLRTCRTYALRWIFLNAAHPGVIRAEHCTMGNMTTVVLPAKEGHCLVALTRRKCERKGL